MEIIPSKSTTALERPKPKINWKYQFQQYGTVLAMAAFLFFILSAYVFYRRGYYDLYIANKAFAGTATALLGIVLLIGSLSRLFSFPDRYVQYRKELGIVAFFLTLVHGVVSFFFLSPNFSLSGFLERIDWPIIFGLTATIVLFAIFLISNDRAMIGLGRERWWRLQYWGIRITFILVFLHVFVMKWSGWVKWYKVGGDNDLVRPEWPGAGILIGWFMIFVVLVRLAEFISPKLGRGIWYVSIIVLPIIYIATFWWGQQFIK